jgi:hypothetical protein
MTIIGMKIGAALAVLCASTVQAQQVVLNVLDADVAKTLV